jgi:hypothetical protein
MFGLLFVLIGVGLVLYESRWRSPANRSTRVLAWCFLGFSSVWTVVAAASTYFEHASLARAVRNGQVQYVEGEVENFVPMPASGHQNEHFEVRGQRFEYSDFEVTAGFNHSASHGGPIAAGRHVKVGYVGHTIVRLEVAQE